MSDEVAADVYQVELVDRPLAPLQRAARWGGTLVAGLLDGADLAPALSDIVIRRDGRELRRLTGGDVGDLRQLHGTISLELETLTPEAFAASWELPE